MSESDPTSHQNGSMLIPTTCMPSTISIRKLKRKHLDKMINVQVLGSSECMVKCVRKSIRYICDRCISVLMNGVSECVCVCDPLMYVGATCHS